MSDNLRDRITAVIVLHTDYVADGIRYCTCGEWSGDSQTTRIGFAAHVADAVLAGVEEIAKMNAKAIETHHNLAFIHSASKIGWYDNTDRH